MFIWYDGEKLIFIFCDFVFDYFKVIVIFIVIFDLKESIVIIIKIFVEKE